ncbi:hypothetical protein C0J52_10201 [Blattella germanica]|nr:hypothetical protein C0J52_10201 [Blattella germanica]
MCGNTLSPSKIRYCRLHFYTGRTLSFPVKCCTLQSDICNAMACFFADLFGLLITDSFTRAMFSWSTSWGLVFDISLHMPLTEQSSESSNRRRNTSIQLLSTAPPISSALWLTVLF